MSREKAVKARNLAISRLFVKGIANQETYLRRSKIKVRS